MISPPELGLWKSHWALAAAEKQPASLFNLFGNSPSSDGQIIRDRGGNQDTINYTTSEEMLDNRPRGSPWIAPLCNHHLETLTRVKGDSGDRRLCGKVKRVSCEFLRGISLLSLRLNQELPSTKRFWCLSRTTVQNLAMSLIDDMPGWIHEQCRLSVLYFQ